MGRRLNAGEVSRYWLGRSLDWVRREPGAFARLQARKLGMFWSWYEWPDAVDYYHVKTLSPILRLPLLERRRVRSWWGLSSGSRRQPLFPLCWRDVPQRLRAYSPAIPHQTTTPQ